MMEVGLYFVSVVQRCQTGEMCQIEMFKYIDKYFNKRSEVFVASIVYGRLISDATFAILFKILYESKKIKNG